MRNMLKHVPLSRLHQACKTWLEQIGFPYYQSLAIREQRLLLFAAIVMPIMIFIFAIALPLHDTRQNKLLALHSLQKQAIEAEALAVNLQKKGPIKIRKSTMTIVDSIANDTQVRQFVTRLRPQIGGHNGQRLLIQMRSTPYNKAVVFLDRLSKQGLSLLSVKIRKAEASGAVHLQAVVE